MRLIDADRLRKELGVYKYGQRQLRTSITKLNIAIERSKVDAVEVVRCKHCRRWTNGDDINGTCNWNEYQTLQTRFDDFCSKGERKEEV